MATKTLSTRISLRYDTFTQWSTVNPVLLKGEMAIANAPINSNSGMTEPAVLIKIGDGTSAYNDLPFITAKAGDVLEACKTEEALKTFVNTVIAESGIATDDAVKAVADAVEKLNGDDTVEGSVAYSIKVAIEALTIENIAGLQDALDAKQDNLEFMTAYDKDTNKVATAADLQKVADDAAQEIASQISATYKPAGTVGSVDDIPAPSKATLGSVYNMSASGTTTDAFVEGAGKVIPEGANIVVVEIPATEEGGEPTYKLDVLGGFVDLTPYAVKADLKNTDAEVANEVVVAVTETDGIVSVVRRALEAADIPELTSEKITDIETKVVETVKEAMTPGTEDNPNVDYDAIADLVAGIVAEELAKVPADGETNNFYNEVEKIVEQMVKDALTPSEDESEADSPVLEAVNTAVDTKIAELDYADTAVDGQFVTQVSQVDGVIAVVRKAITTGDVTGLEAEIQTVIKESLTKPEIADPDNPTADETAAKELYDQIMKEVTELVNNALTGADGSDGSDGADGLTETIEKIVQDAIANAGGEDDGQGGTTPPSGLNTAVKEVITGELDKLDYVDDGTTGVVTKVEQTDGLISVTKTAIGEVEGFDTAVAEGIETILTPPAEGTEPSETYTKLVESITNTVTKEIEKVPADGETNDLTEAIKKAVEDALKEAGQPADPDAGTPEVPASALNTTVNNMIDSKIGELNAADAEETNKVVVAVGQTDGLVEVTKKELSAVAFSGKIEDLDQDGDIIIDCGNAGAGA